MSKTFVRKRQRIDALKEVSLVMAEGEVFGAQDITDHYPNPKGAQR